MITRASDAILLLATLALTCAAIGAAQAGTESFRRSCSNVQRDVSNGRAVVSAICDIGNGREGVAARHLSELVIPPGGCDDIENRRGRLRCVGAGAERPGGSWRASCSSGSYVRGTVFRAMCSASRFAEGLSSIDVAACGRPQLKNVRGRLRCE